MKVSQAGWLSTIAIVVALVFVPRAAHGRGDSKTLVVGSKRFPESTILAELACLEARSRSVPARHAEGLGGTSVTLAALEEGSIDAYPEYTGTLRVVLGVALDAPESALDDALRARRLERTPSIGFQNTYALAVSRSRRSTAGVEKISDLRTRAGLAVLVSSEFLDRKDGWRGLADRYGLGGLRVEAADHALAYEALRNGSVDVVDAYTTDGKIERYGLRLLEDDAHFFPEYRAVFVFRADLRGRIANAPDILAAYTGKSDVDTMTRRNARVELDKASASVVAEELRRGEAHGTEGRASFTARLVRAVVDEGPTHLGLTGLAVALAALLGVPAGLFAARRPRMGALLVTSTSLLQTIPSLALLGVLVPVLGIGWRPALVALTLYGLLPIVRGTVIGLTGIPESQQRAAKVLGLARWTVVRRIELPLALPSILAGVRTSTSVAVGTATLAAFVGAGGFGKPISAGLALADGSTVLTGALPAAALALALDGALALLSRATIAAPLRGASRH